jgi:hypothetical protein
MPMPPRTSGRIDNRKIRVIKVGGTGQLRAKSAHSSLLLRTRWRNRKLVYVTYIIDSVQHSCGVSSLVLLDSLVRCLLWQAPVGVS